MQNEPLRLGSSTSGLTEILPEESLDLIRWKSSYSPEELNIIRTLGKEYAKRISVSNIHALEYFTTCPMLALGLEHPMLEMVKGLGENCKVWSVHAPFDNVDLASPDENTRKQSVKIVICAAKLASELGAKVLTVHPGLELPNMEPRSERLDASGKSIAEIADYCAPFNIKVAVEILPRKCIGNSLEELNTILRIADKQNAGVCLDVNHSFPAKDLCKIVHSLDQKLFTLHISDHDDTDEKHWLPMKGVIDWPALIKSLKEIDYSGPFMYEASLPYSNLDEAINALEENYNKVMEYI